MKQANKVFFNIVILYVRMLFTVFVSLYSTRLILNALGSTDYGIFNLIAGVISLLAFLNTAMATSTLRHLSYYQELNEPVVLNKIFTNSLLLHLLIGFLIVIGLEIASLFLFDSFLNIPSIRIESAKLTYHFMVVSVFLNIIVVPFISSINAHENMLWLAFVSIVDVISKLAIAIFLINTNLDKLPTYGIMIVLVSFLVLILHLFFCLKKYQECTLQKFWIIDKQIIKELFSFAGWNLFGSLCTLGRVEGFAIIFNLFFGTLINSAYGIANQVSGQLSFFSLAILQALNPQILRSEGAGNRSKMIRFSLIASKFSFFLLAIISIPIIFEMNFILKFWLNNVPEFTVNFCRLILIGTMVNQLTIGLQSALQATGKIKGYQIIVGSLILFNLPLAYFLLRQGFLVYSVLISYIIIEFFACFIRILFLKKIAKLSITDYFRKVILKEIIPILSSVSVCYLVVLNYNMNYRFIFTFFLSSISFIISIYFAGLCKDEKEYIKNVIYRIIVKIKALRVSYN